MFIRVTVTLEKQVAVTMDVEPPYDAGGVIYQAQCKVRKISFKELCKMPGAQMRQRIVSEKYEVIESET